MNPAKESENLPHKNGHGSDRVMTIRDVARNAGVSPMTVSRVLNDVGNVRAETRAKVLVSIDKLRFSPNLAARNLNECYLPSRVAYNLIQPKQIRIGLLQSNPRAVYQTEFLVGSLDQSWVGGCQLLIEKCAGPDNCDGAIKKLAAIGADGVILPPPLCDSKEALKTLAKTGLPTVVVGSGRPAPGFFAVGINDFEAARAMTKALIALGHSRIAFIVGDPNQTASEERFKGFVAGMKQAGLRAGSKLVAQGDFSYRSGLAAGERLLHGASRPTAIFASNDDMATAVIAVAHRMRLNVPGDLSVAGFDDTPVATSIWPALTTVHQPIGDMAREAVKLLLDQIRCRYLREAQAVVQKLMEFSLVPRESTARLSTTLRRRTVGAGV
jgi:LacI family transcriptional regulator